MFPKLIKVEERFKFPRGAQVSQVKERYFDAKIFTPSQLNRNVFPHECIDGWYVIDAVKTDSNQVVVTFAKI